MSETRVITKKEAWKQIGHLGRPLLLYIVLFMVLRHGMTVLQTFFPDILLPFSTDILMLGGQLILTLFMTLIPFQIGAAALKLKIRDYLQNPHLGLYDTISIACIGTAVELTAVLAASLTGAFSSQASAETVFLGHFNSREYIIANVLYFLLFVIVKPMCDEFIFRGIIQRQLGHYGRYFGVLASALLYAAAQPDPRLSLPCFAIGWYLSVLTLHTHSIRPAIRVHFITELLFWLLEIIPANLLFLEIPATLIIYIIAFWRIIHRKSGTLLRTGAAEKKLWEILFTTPSVILCFFLFAVNIALTFLL